MPSGFHPYTSLLTIDIVRLIIDVSDPDLCGVGSDVLCWIESVGEGDPPPSGMTASGYQASALDTQDPENGLMAGEWGSEYSSNDSGWLASDTSGLLGGNVNDYAPGGDLLEGMSASGDFSSAPGDISPDYSMFSR